MIATTQDRLALLRYLAVFAAAAVMLALLPSGGAEAQDPTDNPADACPIEAPEAGFTDRNTIPSAHQANVDCAAEFDIVAGFGDNTYRPGLQVRRDQMASFIALTLDAAGVDLPPGTSTFTDVGAGNVHAPNINRLAAAGIVEGAPEDLGAGQYGPDRRTRRDQMASFLIRAAGYAYADDVDFFDDATQRFTDVPAGNVHFEKVNAASVTGLSVGTGGNQYSPRAETRRDQMASFVVRLLNFLAVPVEVEVTSPATAPAGETATATATVTSQFGQLMQGAPVTFTATALAPVLPPLPETATTGANGEAAFDFRSLVAQTVTVTASIEAPGGNFEFGPDEDTSVTEFVN